VNDYSVHQVEVQLEDKSQLTITARSVVFATGSGTRKALETIQFPDKETLSQEIEKVFLVANLTMICVKGTFPA
jgi:pyruvate/2-oxoglutarate dehydrogenase complex dihydrolipoamide dehydrogenase (E3) component